MICLIRVQQRNSWRKRSIWWRSYLKCLTWSNRSTVNTNRLHSKETKVARRYNLLISRSFKMIQVSIFRSSLIWHTISLTSLKKRFHSSSLKHSGSMSNNSMKYTYSRQLNQIAISYWNQLISWWTRFRSKRRFACKALRHSKVLHNCSLSWTIWLDIFT